METIKREFPLWTILIIFVVILFSLVTLSNYPKRLNADMWEILIIMAVFGLIGAVIGSVLGGIIGLIGKLYKKNTLIPGLKYGAAIGFIGL